LNNYLISTAISWWKFHQTV